MDMVKQIIFWVVILMVLWYVGKPFIGGIWFGRKNMRGIPTSLSLEQVVELLEKHPWCENQNIRMETVPMFEAPPQPRIHLNTLQGEADIYVEDRRLCGEIHVSQTYLSAAKGFRRDYLKLYEIHQMLKFIAYYADPNNSDDGGAENLKAKSANVAHMWGKSEKAAESGASFIRMGAQILISGMVLFLAVFFVYSSLRFPVKDLKSIVFEDYGSITLGEAVEKNLRNEEWSKEKVDDTHYEVTLSGFIPKEYANISITFDVNYADDHVYASARKFKWNDNYYDNSYMISQALEAIYGGNPWLL